MRCQEFGADRGSRRPLERMPVVSELRAGLGLRWTRAGVTAVVACSLGLMGHLMAGGLLPSGGWFLVCLGTVWVASAMLLGRPAGRLRIIVLVAGGQATFHLMLTALAGHGSGNHVRTAGHFQAPVSLSALRPPTGSSDRRGSYFDVTAGNAPEATAQRWTSPHWITHLVDDLTGPHAAMAVAHLIAAAGIACWLALAEQAVWVLVCLLGVTVLSVLVSGVHPPTRALVPSISHRVPVRRPAGPRPKAPPRRSRLQRRGPPPPRLTSLCTLT